MKSKNLYKVLEVSEDATKSEINKAYKRLAQKYHPDKENGDEEKFKKLAYAYSILSDETKRKYYDLYGEEKIKVFDEEVISSEYIDKFLIPLIEDKNHCDIMMIKIITKKMIESNMEEVNKRKQKLKNKQGFINGLVAKHSDQKEHLIIAKLKESIKQDQFAIDMITSNVEIVKKFVADFSSKYSYDFVQRNQQQNKYVLT